MGMIKELTILEIGEIYEKYMTKDFPKNELKPLVSIERMYHLGCYKGFVLEEEQEIRAYWLLLRDVENKAYLLDYLAVISGNRGLGYGSKVLKIIQDLLESEEVIVIEAENPQKACNIEEKQLQERRLDFYRRNGVIFTNLASVVYEAPYVIMLLSKEKKDFDVEEVTRIYMDFYEKWILGKEKCKKHLIMEKY